MRLIRQAVETPLVRIRAGRCHLSFAGSLWVQKSDQQALETTETPSFLLKMEPRVLCGLSLSWEPQVLGAPGLADGAPEAGGGLYCVALGESLQLFKPRLHYG